MQFPEETFILSALCSGGLKFDMNSRPSIYRTSRGNGNMHGISNCTVNRISIYNSLHIKVAILNRTMVNRIHGKQKSSKSSRTVPSLSSILQMWKIIKIILFCHFWQLFLKSLHQNCRMRLKKYLPNFKSLTSKWIHTSRVFPSI